MMEDKKINVDGLIDSLLNMTKNHPEILDDMLRERGYNPEQLERNGIAQIKGVMFRAQVNQKKQQQENLYAKALSMFETAKADTKEVILSLLRERAPKLQFRNLEKLEEDDLKEILNESDILDLMEQIDKSNIA
jgi:broad-specificity NMP kinase